MLELRAAEVEVLIARSIRLAEPGEGAERMAFAVARMVSEGRARWGIVIDGAGIGSCIATSSRPTSC